MSDFRSRRSGHVLQRDEKIDLIFEFLRRLAKSRFPDIYDEVRLWWLEGNS